MTEDIETHAIPPQPKKGRGALSNPTGRFDIYSHEDTDDGWNSLDDLPDRLPTTLSIDTAKTVISYNDSPDIPFDRSINPYRGCEHGCVYCFARPTHAYLGLSPGLDFETKLFYKPDAPELLREELRARRYRPQPIALGINTDAYQPIERKLGLTRKILEVLQEARHPVSIVTKSSLIERDLDILSEMAARGLVQVAFSITTLQTDLARSLEPRATAPKRRLQSLATLSTAGIPTSVLVAPLIPMLNDMELETILSECRNAGAVDAGYVFLRLPHELKDIFAEWLAVHVPLKAEHIMQRIFDARGGKAYDSAFGIRMTGTGEYADLLKQRFRLAKKKLAFPGEPAFNLTAFRPPQANNRQLDLFWD
ncbi:MAG: PA0069 family radical SAM protein [Methylococcaceae bacterium]|nr:PA0069 family radical SAM protein [Methylococcaceae bacterium]